MKKESWSLTQINSKFDRKKDFETGIECYTIDLLGGAKNKFGC